MFLLSAQWWQHDLVRAFCWTLVHSCWQGLLAAVLAGLVIITTRHATARLRYNLLVSTLMLFFAATCITFYYQAGTVSAAVPPVSSFVATSNTTVTGTSLTVVVYKEPAKPFIDLVIAGLNRYASIIVLIWSVFFIIKSIRLAGGLRYLHHIRHHKTYEPTAAWKNKMQYLSNKLGIKKSIRLMESGIIKVPVAIGYFKPVILLPVGMLMNLPAEQAEAILLHELAHTLRRDYLANLLQYIIETIFFFNPALLWLSERIREEREACCDDVVVAHTYNKRAYLDALVSFHEYNIPSATLAMALGKKRMHLLDRVKRLLTQENKKLNTFEKLAMLLGLLVITLFGFINRPEPIAKKPVAPVIKKESVQYTIPAILVQHNVSRPTQQVRELKPSKVFLQTIPDTIPAPSVRKDSIILYNDIRIRTVQTVHIDHPYKKTQVITAVDRHNNTFVIRKDNDEVTELTINNKIIPQTAMPQHQSLFVMVDIAMRADVEQRQKDPVHQNAERQQQQDEQRRQKEEKQHQQQYEREQDDRKDQADKIRGEQQRKSEALRKKIEADADRQRAEFKKQQSKEEQKRREEEKAKKMEEKFEKAAEAVTEEQWKLKTQDVGFKRSRPLFTAHSPLFKPRDRKPPTPPTRYTKSIHADTTKYELQHRIELKFKDDPFFKVDSQKTFRLNTEPAVKNRHASLFGDNPSKKDEPAAKNVVGNLVQEQMAKPVETFNRFLYAFGKKR